MIIRGSNSPIILKSLDKIDYDLMSAVLHYNGKIVKSWSTADIILKEKIIEEIVPEPEEPTEPPIEPETPNPPIEPTPPTENETEFIDTVEEDLEEEVIQKIEYQTIFPLKQNETILFNEKNLIFEFKFTKKDNLGVYYTRTSKILVEDRVDLRIIGTDGMYSEEDNSTQINMEITTNENVVEDTEFVTKIKFDELNLKFEELNTLVGVEPIDSVANTITEAVLENNKLIKTVMNTIDFYGTQLEWDALTEEDKAIYDMAYITVNAIVEGQFNEIEKIYKFIKITEPPSEI